MFIKACCGSSRVIVRCVLNAVTFLALAFPANSTKFTVAESLNSYPLTDAQVGDLLVGELRCLACHSGTGPNAFLDKAAPNLADVGSRVSPEYLQRFLAAPSATQPGTTMPNVMDSFSVEKRNEMAEALTHFLVAQSKHPFQPESSRSLDSNVGKDLFHSVGCVACHQPREKIEREEAEDDDEASVEPAEKPSHKRRVVSLDHLPQKYSPKSLTEFLFHPLPIRSSGRMPDMKLTTEESQAIARYLLGAKNPVPEPLKPRDSLITVGKRLFQELNCAACHSLEGFTAKQPIASLTEANFNRGCLSDTHKAGPRFQLEASQTRAIIASLTVAKKPDSDQIVLAKTLTAFNCIACHVRDDFGGVAKDRNPFFRSSEKNLGDDGRIPPPLTLVGAKLQPVWLKKVLFDGESVRPHMMTRMPQYGETNLRHIPETVARLDKIEPVDLNLPSPESNNKDEQEREKKLRAGGRELLGDKGLNCVACHNFNGKPSPINKGMDLITTYQRLQPAWFNNFLRKPGAYRPRIVMPYSWPDGIAAHKTILDGDTDLQIEAIWYYLSLGTSAADPSGIRRIDTKLDVGDAARTYRGRSSVSGFRGIAVGFPEKLSYAFNAETGTLSAIWQGDFIRVDRGGQGSGGFNPSAKPIQLAQDVSFLELADESTPWPLRPVMTKEAPVNPNPLYPKNLGYQFHGYSLDEMAIPTFEYHSGPVEIQDRSVAVHQNDKLLLKRRLQFSAPSKQTLWFRAMTGEITSETDRIYKTSGLRLSIPEGRSMIRTISESPKSQELLLKLDVQPGKSTLEFTYELLEK
jgi:mono/diheme cytochrome c family protein